MIRVLKVLDYKTPVAEETWFVLIPKNFQLILKLTRDVSQRYAESH